MYKNVLETILLRNIKLFSIMKTTEKYVDVVFIGGGPCTLGLIWNAIRNNRMSDLISGESIAIIEKTGLFGGGYLQQFGINSNTAGDGFIRWIMKKEDKKASGSKTVIPIKQ